MGVRVVNDEGKSALFDSVSLFTFGPVFDGVHGAWDFLNWYSVEFHNEPDLRTLHDEQWRYLLDQYSLSQEGD